MPVLFKIIIIYLVLFSQPATIISQNYSYSINDSDQSACGRTSLSENSYSYVPAQLREIRNSAVAFSISPYPYGLREISPASLILGHRISQNIVVAGNLSGMGNALFNEFSGALLAAVAIGETISLGVKSGFSRMSIRNFNNYIRFDISIGGIIELADWAEAGINIDNITRSSYSDISGINDNIYQKILIGFGIEGAEDFFVDVDAVIYYKLFTGFKTSIRYDFLDIFSAKVAFQTAPRTFEAGVRVGLPQNMRFYANVNYHYILGFRQNFELTYLF